MIAEKECTGIGVLDSSPDSATLYTWYPGTKEINQVPVTSQAMHAGTLYELGIAQRLNTLWLCPGSYWSLYFHKQPGAFAPGSLEATYKISVKRREGDGTPQNARINIREGKYGFRPLLYILLPDHDPTWLEDLDNAGQSWSFSDVENAPMFHATLIAIHQRTGAYLSTSPASTGIQSMRELTKESDWQREPGEETLPGCMPTQMYWHRKLFTNEQGWYLHRYDRNSMFLAAATGAELGIGMPSYLEREDAIRIWRESTPVGIWQVDVQDHGHRGILIPGKKEWEGQRWLTTSGVRALHNLNYQVEIQACWIWPNSRENRITRSRRVLQPWAKHMWNARMELLEKYGKKNPAYRLIKMIANRGMGWLDLRMLGKDEKPKWYNKPHWYAEIQALAQYRMTITIQDIKQKYGAYPVLVYSDALCYLSREPDPRLAFPDLVRRERELGGFKPDMTLLVDSDIAAAFDQAGTFQVLQSLKAIEAGHGTHV